MTNIALSLPAARWVLWVGGLAVVVFLLCLPRLLGIVYIPHTQVGIIEKIWSSKGSLREGQIIARNGEAGYQAKFLRGGIHFGLYPWQYRIHKEPLVSVAEGKMAYVYARDGVPLQPIQPFGRKVDSNHFQDAIAFLEAGGQRGRQRGILREGVYAINLALFVVITEERVFSGPVRESADRYELWKAQLLGLRAFDPVVIGSGVQRHLQGYIGDTSASEAGAPPSLVDKMPEFNPNVDAIGVVSIQDGPTIGSGEIIAPEVKAVNGRDHNYFQDPEAFLQLGGKRGKQLQVLTDGTFFINRWFGTVEIKAKTLIPIGYVGVVVSYHGAAGDDTTGESFRYGEQVEAGHRGVWRSALTPGKYALNPYAVKVELVPTINFVLRWISGQTEAHHYDEDLTSIDLITADGYEPRLPLSLVLHIDYQKAPSVVQRFGDVKRLITQTLDPILTAYFRDVAQSSHMLDLLTKREEIQKEATEQLGQRFKSYDINVVAVLIGRPESKEIAPGKADPIDTQAQFAEAEQLAKKQVALAEGEARSKELIGKGESSRIAQVGLAEAAVTLQKVGAYRDPRLYALNVFAEQFSHSVQPLVPNRLFINNAAGKDGEGQPGGGNVLETLLSLILSEKAGINISGDASTSRPLEDFIQKFTGNRGQSDRGQAKQETASTATAGKRDNSG